MKRLFAILFMIFILTGCTQKEIDPSRLPVNKEDTAVGQDNPNKETQKTNEELIDSLQSMPEFEELNLDGKKVSSKDFKGKITIINFFNTWNLDSTKEVNLLGELNKSYVDKGMELVFINSTDKIEDIKKFGKEHPITSSHMILDSDGKISKAFKVNKVPTTYIIDRNLRVVARYARLIDKNEMKLVLDALQ